MATCFGRNALSSNYAPNGDPYHVLIPINDHLGSATVLIDRDSGEVVERADYLPYGQLEGDGRPGRWDYQKTPYKFTGHEDDSEFGLHYTGARYYNPYLGRFISPDPLTIHALSGDPNPYAYVHGRVTSLVDPLGLDAGDPIDPQAGGSSGQTAGQQEAQVLDLVQYWANNPTSNGGWLTQDMRNRPDATPWVPLDGGVELVDPYTFAQMGGTVSPDDAGAPDWLTDGMEAGAQRLLNETGLSWVVSLDQLWPGHDLPGRLHEIWNDPIGSLGGCRGGICMGSALPEGEVEAEVFMSRAPSGGRPAVPGDNWNPDVVSQRASINGMAKNGPLAARVLGYDRRVAPDRLPFNSHGQPGYFDGRTYITPDVGSGGSGSVDSHIGGSWKMFDRSGNRLGTYDMNLERIGD
jgi:RHS repeat-associated protein